MKGGITTIIFFYGLLHGYSGGCEYLIVFHAGLAGCNVEGGVPLVVLEDSQVFILAQEADYNGQTLAPKVSSQMQQATVVQFKVLLKKKFPCYVSLRGVR